jgi:mono/diheme cytochrome c family protein
MRNGDVRRIPETRRIPEPRKTPGARWIRGTLLLLFAASCAETKSPGEAGDPVARGRYLVEAVADCGQCHTPRLPDGSPDPKRPLAGSDVGYRGPWGTSYAANLTPDVESGVGAMSDPELIDAIRNRTSLPPMPSLAYSRMTDEDLRAIVAYLRSLPPDPHRVPKELPPGETPPGPVIVHPR